ncbi:hypothetical protein, conserved [Eimeria maxima]|uniref:Pre-mRNA polyadenylation factor Fip1 domain-containing protein n=1 Tax=Eimeria maxima TaxID=5804 RepID=U6M9Z7_EIMMA|nr:hypothetical protein, conserved [Eimeria maxima]CDJ59314.1 hypothetical protein, conserved [Eimeria maxima]
MKDPIAASSAEEDVQVLVGDALDGAASAILSEPSIAAASGAAGAVGTAAELPPAKRLSAAAGNSLSPPSKKGAAATTATAATADAADDIDEVLGDSVFPPPSAAPPATAASAAAAKAADTPQDPQALCAAATAAGKVLPEWEVSGNKRWLYTREKSYWFNYGFDHRSFVDWLQQQLDLRLQRSARMPLHVQGQDWSPQQQHQQQQMPQEQHTAHTQPQLLTHNETVLLRRHQNTNSEQQQQHQQQHQYQQHQYHQQQQQQPLQTIASDAAVFASSEGALTATHDVWGHTEQPAVAAPGPDTPAPLPHAALQQLAALNQFLTEEQRQQQT